MAKNQEILSDDTQRTIGRNAQRNNIIAAKLVADTVRSTLGPKGMDKMLVNQMGDVIVTNDGATILREVAIEHPTAKMIVEIAKTQEDEVGDGTTTAVIIAGELLNNAERLLSKNIHPTIITQGYRLAAHKALDILQTIKRPIQITDTDLLEKIAQTAMTGKGAEVAKEVLSDLTVKAVIRVADKQNGLIDRDHIRMQVQVGKEPSHSTIVDGLVVDKARVHGAMPSQLDHAKIVLINAPIEIRTTEMDAKITIQDPSQMEAFLAQEERMLRGMVDRIIKSGASVVICQKGIDDLAQHYLAKAGILALRRVRKQDIDALALATGARVMTNLQDITPQDIGHCSGVKQIKIHDEFHTLFSGCKNTDVVTLMLYGSTEHVAGEVERAVDDALGDLCAALATKSVVGGAGAPEAEMSRQLRSYAETLSGKQQLAVMAFADAVESIPITLAENAGLDPIDVMTSLKAAHERKQITAGVNVFTGEIIDAWEHGIIEPLKIKTQAISAASEVAIMVLRIDDIIAAGPPAEHPHDME